MCIGVLHVYHMFTLVCICMFSYLAEYVCQNMCITVYVYISVARIDVCLCSICIMNVCVHVLCV